MLRVSVAALELTIVLLAIVLLLALARQILTMGYLVMGHDDDYYLAVARAVAGGLVPYRDFAFEYPPLALVPIVVPYLAWLPGGLDGAAYAGLLAVENALTVAATAAALAWLAHRGWSARTSRRTVVAYVGLVAATPILFWRFDAVPALLSVLAVCAFAAGRAGWAGLAIAGGAIAKLYPIVLLPVLGLRSAFERRWRELGRLVVASLAPLVAGLALLVAGGGAIGASFLGYQATRGVQLESVPASVALLAHALADVPVTAVQGFGSWQLESPFLEQFGWLWLVAAAAVFGLLAIAAVMSYRDDVRRDGHVNKSTVISTTAATVVAALLCYRVLSPQYLVWLLPFAALLPRHKLMTVLAACVLTLYIFPFGYDGLVGLAPHAIFALALRNALLLGLFISLILPGLSVALRQLRRRTSSTESSLDSVRAPSD